MLQDIWTVFWRDWVVLKRRLTKFILSRMVAPILYLVAFGWGLGRSIQVDTGTYLDFLVPGILALNSMNISFNSITPVHAERIYHKSLEEYMIAPIWPDAFVIGKVLAHWLVSGLPLTLLAPVLGLQFDLAPDALLTLTLALLIGTPALSGIGAIGAALTLGVRGGGVLLSLLILPLYIPVLIFGSGAVEAVVAGMSAQAHLSLLGALTLGSVFFAPWPTAAALRIALE